VYPFGTKKPPLCHSCAIARAGIRKHAARSKVASRRELKRLEKERKRKAKTTRDAEPAVEVTTMDIGPALREDLDDEPAADRPPPPAPAPGAIDWSAPFQSGSLSTH
jgi:hypothetical protein